MRTNDWEAMVAIASNIVFLGVVFAFVVRAFMRNIAWSRSAACQEEAYLEQHGLVASARIRAVEPWACEPVTEVVRVRVGRSGVRTRTYERVGVRLVVELLPLGAERPIVAERTQTVRSGELDRIRPGALLLVLYDPTSPTRFYLDTIERGQMITAATLRTQEAERHAAAAKQWGAFPQGPGSFRWPGA